MTLPQIPEKWRTVLPSRSLLLLLGIGLIDLASTALLHAGGQIVELNPLMRPLLLHSEWLFVFVKGLTLVACWKVMVWYWPQNREFVRRCCLLGSGAYLAIWTTWFLIGTFS